MKTKYIKVDPRERLPTDTRYYFVETVNGKDVMFFLDGKFISNEEFSVADETWLVDYWLEEVEDK